MTSETSQHDWFAERIATYLTDGMSGEERNEFEAHAAGCADCAGKLAWAKGEDESLRELFAEIAPSAGFEDRVIQRLRRSGWKMPGMIRPIRLRPAIVKAATAAAAIVLVGGLGYWTVQGMQGRQTGGAGQTLNVPEMGQAVVADLAPGAATQPGEPLSYTYANPYPDIRGLGRGYRVVNGLQPTFGVAADIAATQLHGLRARTTRQAFWLTLRVRPLPERPFPQKTGPKMGSLPQTSRRRRRHIRMTAN